MSYPQLNRRDGSHDPWPGIPAARGVDPYRHELVVGVVQGLGLTDPWIVDVGCGDGVTLGLLQAAGFSQLIGVDLSLEGLTRAKVRAPLATLALSDLTVDKLEPLRNCDVAICTEVLEHLPKDEHVSRVMRLLHRVLGVGGWAIISVPDDSICEVDPDHRRLFTPEDPRRLLEAAGFVDVEEIRYRYSDAYPWPWMTAKGRKP